METIQQLQAEQPIQIIANTLLYEAGHKEWLADGKKVDIEAIITEFMTYHEEKLWVFYLREEDALKIIAKHLTQKTSVPKDVEVVEINKIYIDDWYFGFCNCWWTITNIIKKCDNCQKIIKRID